MEKWIKIKTNQFSTYHFNKYIKQCIIEMYFDDRLYWLDRTILKSSTTTGTDIKSQIITNGATDVFLYKVICYNIVFGNSLSKIWPSIINNDFFLFSAKDCLGWINGDRLYFLRRRISNITEYVVKTIQNTRNVAVFDASLQNDKRGI